MKRWLLWIAALVAIPIIGIAIFLIAYFTVDPSFTASAHKLDNGDYRIDIEPNFVVFKIRGVKITDRAGTVFVDQDGYIDGSPSFVLPAAQVTTDQVTVKCLLVYDRPMPSLTDHTETVQIP